VDQAADAEMSSGLLLLTSRELAAIYPPCQGMSCWVGKGARSSRPKHLHCGKEWWARQRFAHPIPNQMFFQRELTIRGHAELVRRNAKALGEEGFAETACMTLRPCQAVKRALGVGGILRLERNRVTLAACRNCRGYA